MVYQLTIAIIIFYVVFTSYFLSIQDLYCVELVLLTTVALITLLSIFIIVYDSK